jgi:hypothetical protein
MRTDNETDGTIGGTDTGESSTDTGKGASIEETRSDRAESGTDSRKGAVTGRKPHG